MWVPVMVGWIAWLAGRELVRPMADGAAGLVGRGGAEGRAAASCVAMLGAVLGVYTLASSDIMDVRTHVNAVRVQFRDRTNDEFFRAISLRRGLMLTVRDFGLITLKTGRPLLIDPSILDHLACTPQSAKVVNHILNRVYGADLRAPAPHGVDPHGSIPPAMHHQLWEDRTREDWQGIRREFGVTDVLTPTNFTLRLPVVLRDDRGLLYEIPAD